MANKKQVSFNQEENKFIEKMGGMKYEFIPKHKLYVHQAYNKKRKGVYVQTVEENEKMFTERQKKDAAMARKAQMRMGYPSVKDMVSSINHGIFMNLPITKADIDNAIRIWGPDMGSVVGKTTRNRPDKVVVDPTEINVGKNIILCTDIFYIGGLTFVMSISRGLCTSMVSHLENRKVSSLQKALMNQISTYLSKGFKIIYLLIDNESAINMCTSDLNTKGVTVNQTAKNEHVPEIERAGRTMKERVRAIWNTLPYKLTNDMVVRLVYYACTMINMFPKSNSIGGRPPRELFTGIRVDFKRDCKLGYGEDVQVYADEDITNTMKPRTLGAICVGVSGNLQGTYLFLSLATWKILKRRQWVEMPIPQDVINLINNRAEKVRGVSITSEMRMGGSTIGEESEDIYICICTRSSGGERYPNRNSRAARRVGTNLRE